MPPDSGRGACFKLSAPPWHSVHNGTGLPYVMLGRGGAARRAAGRSSLATCAWPVAPRVASTAGAYQMAAAAEDSGRVHQLTRALVGDMDTVMATVVQLLAAAPEGTAP